MIQYITYQINILMTSAKLHIAKKVPHLQEILERLKEQMRERGETQRSLAQRIPCHAGQLSKALAGNTLPSANMLIGIAKSGYDMNYILRGELPQKSLQENWEKDKEKLLFHIERLESLLTNK